MSIYNIAVDFKRIFMGTGFYLCVILTFLLCMTGAIYNNPFTNENYSLLGIIIANNSDLVCNNANLCFVNVIDSFGGSWLSMFLPIVTTFVFSNIICDEYESHMVRNTIIRTTKKQFFLSKFVSASIAGGMAVLLGFLLFTMVAGIYLPSVDSFPTEIQLELQEKMKMIYPNIAANNIGIIIAYKAIAMFISGLIWSIPSILMTAICRNKYLVVCVPFFVKYAMTQTCLNLSMQQWNHTKEMDLIVAKVINVISPDSLMYLFQSNQLKQMLFFYGVLVCIEFIVYVEVQKGRVDCGQ